MSDFQSAVQAFLGPDWRSDGDRILRHARHAVHLISLDAIPEPETCLALSDGFERQGKTLVHLWEDTWRRDTRLVQSRLRAMSGQFARVSARLTDVRPVTRPERDRFFAHNHLQGTVKMKYGYGLFLKDKYQNAGFSVPDGCVAMAGFGAMRPMPSRGEGYRSGELVRFANALDHLVVGGLDKLVQAFLRDHAPDDVMTYADRDWSTGGSYEKLGFRRVGATPVQFFWLDPDTLTRYYPERLDVDPDPHWIRVFNTGNYKYLLEKR